MTSATIRKIEDKDNSVPFGLIWMPAESSRLATDLRAGFALSRWMARLPASVEAASQQGPADLATADICLTTANVLHRSLAACARALGQERTRRASDVILVAGVRRLCMTTGRTWASTELIADDTCGAGHWGNEDGCAAMTGDLVEGRSEARRARPSVIWLRAGMLTAIELASTDAVTHVKSERVFVFLMKRPTPLLLVSLLIGKRTALRDNTASDL